MIEVLKSHFRAMAIISSSKSTGLQKRAWFNIDMQEFKQYYLDNAYDLFLQWRRIKSPSAKSRRVFTLRIYLSTNEVF